MYGEIGGRILSCPGGGQCYVKGAERVRHTTPLLFNSFGLLLSFSHSFSVKYHPLASLRPCNTASFPRFFRVLDGNFISFLSP